MGHDKISPITRIATCLIFAISLVFLVAAAATGYPFGLVYDDSALFTALFRIAIGLLMLLRVLRSFLALPLIFGYDQNIKSNLLFPKGIYYFKALMCLLVIIGFYTDIAAALLFLAYVLVFWKSRYFSIEEVYFQNSLFHLIFLGAGRVYSLDSLMGNESLLGSAVFFNSFFLSNGFIMLSAGYEKFKSKLWRSGKGTSYFFNSPHLLKKRFHSLNKLPHAVMFLLSYMVVIGEFIFPFAALHPIVLFLTLFVLLGFSTSLFTVIDISFIGQILSLNLLFFIALNLSFWDRLDPSILMSVSKEQILEPIVMLCILMNGLTLIITLYYPIATKLNLDKIQHLLTGIIGPIGVFTEKHQYGFYIYRIVEKESQKVVFDAFDEHGYPGKYQMLYPRYFQAAMYPG